MLTTIKLARRLETMQHTPPRARNIASLSCRYIEHCRALYRSRESDNIASSLKRLTANLDQLKPAELRNALAILEHSDHLSTSYRAQTWRRWMGFVRWCVEHEHAPAKLLLHCSTFKPRWRVHDDQVDQDEPAQPFTLAMVRATLQVIAKRYRIPIQIIALTGARPVEILSLRNTDIDTSREPWTASLTRHKTSHSTNRPRVLVFAPTATQLLDRARRPLCPMDWLFPAPMDSSRPLSRQTLAQAIANANKRHHLNAWCLYDLRRHAARVARAQASLDAAQALLGHTSPLTTERYAPVDHHAAGVAAAILDKEVQL